MTVKRIDIKEFQEFGFLHEVNRLFFHPLGLALEVIVPDPGEQGEIKLGGVWDFRDDPEGIRFKEVDPEKIARVKEFMEKKHADRMRTLGYIYQPETDTGEKKA
jgi:hypothetical protein